MPENRARLFADLLRMDAWREYEGEPAKAAAIHVEMSFQNGFFGGNSQAIPFTFSANLRRAVLKIHVEQPMKIDRRSVARSVPSKEIELNKYLSIKKEVTSAAGARVSINVRRFAAGLSGTLKGESHVSKGEEQHVRETVPAILVKAQPGGGNEYRWEMEPSYQNHLEGQPWDPITEPRLHTIWPDGVNPNEYSIRAFVECNRVDIDVFDLKLKDDGTQARIENLLFRDMNEKAAIQYIKWCLEGAELNPGMLDNRFSNVTLADILVSTP